MSGVSGIQGQLLEVTVVACIKLKDTEWISRQDPYVVVEYGSTKYRTRTCTDGGKNPTFQEKFVFTLIEGLRELNVVVWNSNTLTYDDLIGSGKIQLHKVLSEGYDDNTWPLQDKKGRHAGEIRLITHYASANKPTKNHAPQTSYAPSAPQTSYAPSAPQTSYAPSAPPPPYGNVPAPQAPLYSSPPPSLSPYPPSSYPAPSPYPSPYPPQTAYPPPPPYNQQPAPYPPTYPPAYPSPPSVYPPVYPPPPQDPHYYPQGSYPPAPYPPRPY